MKSTNPSTNPPRADGGQAAPAELSARKQGCWTIISLAIAALSVWAVASQWKGFSLQRFLDAVASADKRWLAAGVLAMLGFVLFEGRAVRCACHALHYDVSPGKGIGYAAADIYFSAITPSASGGQPACAYLMMRDGIPGIVATAALLNTLAMYSLSILVLGVVCLALRAPVLARFGTPSLILIGLGLVAQIALAIFFWLLVHSERLLEKLCRGVLTLLSKLRLVRHVEKRRRQLEAHMEEYRRCASLLGGHRAMLIQSFVYNLLQRASQVAVPMFVYLAMGGAPGRAADLFATQALVVIGSNCVPVPGAMGVADYLMLDGFGGLLPPDQVIHLELLGRALSFYCCVLLCGLLVLAIIRRKRKAVEP